MWAKYEFQHKRFRLKRRDERFLPQILRSVIGLRVAGSASGIVWNLNSCSLSRQNLMFISAKVFFAQWKKLTKKIEKRQIRWLIFNNIFLCCQWSGTWCRIGSQARGVGFTASNSFPSDNISLPQTIRAKAYPQQHLLEVAPLIFRLLSVIEIQRWL